MRLDIRKVKECKNGAFGNFIIRNKESALITISIRKNPTVAEYAATLLHEMLHCYTSLLRAEGFKLTDKNEHKYIEASEVAVVSAMRKIIPRRK